MATSIFPDLQFAGAVVIRDAAGVALLPPGVHNAYAPLPAYISTCLITALPSDCDARIEPRQINAIVSELVAFAECLDPNGPWDCLTLHNICTAFQVWAAENVFDREVLVVPPELIGTGVPGDPIKFTGITAHTPTFSGKGLSTMPLILEIVDGGVY
jgi:hypothetical protein